MDEKEKQPQSKNKIIWLIALILLICVALTTLVITETLNLFTPSDEGAIPLIPEQSATETTPAAEETESANQVTQSTETTEATESPKIPGFQTSDDNTVWSNKTSEEIFKVTYEDGDQRVTVKSDDGDKLIAPGTENSYTFKLKNTGDVAMDYTVELDAYITPGDVTIPITARLCRYDGKWVAGGKDSYCDVPTLDQTDDSGTLGVGKFTYYTLDWVWPYEGGNDELDTMLGNMAAGQDVTLTISIKTRSTVSGNPDATDGIMPPKTGDSANLTMLIALMLISLAMLSILIPLAEKEKQRHNREAKRS